RALSRCRRRGLHRADPRGLPALPVLDGDLHAHHRARRSAQGRGGVPRGGGADGRGHPAVAHFLPHRVRSREPAALRAGRLGGHPVYRPLARRPSRPVRALRDHGSPARARCGVVLVVIIPLILPTRIRLSTDVSAIPKLRADLASLEGNLNVIRADLQALALEAKRQVRWAEMLNAFRQQIPATLKLQKVEVAAAPATSAPAPSGQAQPVGAPPPGAWPLRIEGVSPLRPGPPPLIEIAQFMGGLMKDPTVGRRYQLKSWEIKQAAAAGSQ